MFGHFVLAQLSQKGSFTAQKTEISSKVFATKSAQWYYRIIKYRETVITCSFSDNYSTTLVTIDQKRLRKLNKVKKKKKSNNFQCDDNLPTPFQTTRKKRVTGLDCPQLARFSPDFKVRSNK